VRYCLAEGQVGAGELDAVVFYDKPLTKFSRILKTYFSVAPRGLRSFLMALPLWLRQKLWIPADIEQALEQAGAGTTRAMEGAIGPRREHSQDQKQTTEGSHHPGDQVMMPEKIEQRGDAEHHRRLDNTGAAKQGRIGGSALSVASAVTPTITPTITPVPDHRGYRLVLLQHHGQSTRNRFARCTNRQIPAKQNSCRCRTSPTDS